MGHYFLDGNIKMNTQTFIHFSKTGSVTKFTKTQRSDSTHALFLNNHGFKSDKDKTS